MNNDLRMSSQFLPVTASRRARSKLEAKKLGPSQWTNYVGVHPTQPSENRAKQSKNDVRGFFFFQK